MSRKGNFSGYSRNGIYVRQGQKMKEGQVEYIRTAKRVVDLFYQGRGDLLTKYCTEDARCIVPDFCREMRLADGGNPKKGGKDTDGIIHKNYRLIYQGENVGIVTGCFCRMQEDENWNATIALFRSPRGMRIKHIHISKPTEERFLMIKDIREQLYRICESQIIYLEAFDSHILWHCREATVETVGVLGKVEKTLSENFVRVHRSYIINYSHIYLVARCYARMDNGDILQIPVKKYCDVKKKLAEKSKMDFIP